METSDFKCLFQNVTGNSEPFPWQEALFEEFRQGQIRRSLDIPTGLGKTAVMAIWLLARIENPSLPRRLVYIVDRRAVVDQATEEANKLQVAVKQFPELGAALKLNGQPLPISTLRGQHVDNRQWLDDPSSPAIIVGTIDMIGSRLLFEGYGVSRKMRPYHAGLLGVNTLFILDEAHLVPPFEMLLDAIASDSAKVAPRAEEKDIIPPFKFMSLSATGRTRSDCPFSLTDNDLKHPIVQKRLEAKKRLTLKQLQPEEGLPNRESLNPSHPDPLPLKQSQTEKDLTPAQLDSSLAKSLAHEAWEITKLGTKAVRIMVFCNKRKVAEAAKQVLEQKAKKAGQPDITDRTELFVGGRRVRERETAAARLRVLGFIAGEKPALTQPVFVFATSAGEVGVDLDADHMVSDLVEWERMVQRLGRVNRRGEGDAQVIVLLEPDPKPDAVAKAAYKKDADKRNEKDIKAIEAHQHKVELAQAKQKPYNHLPSYDDGSRNASPGAIRELKTRANSDETLRAILDAATTPEPLRPALTRPIVDAWSMTSLEEHTGRPEVGPWLRGWVDEDPQTAVIWRKYLPTRTQGRVTRKEVEAFFEAAPPHTSEVLETETDSVLSWLKKRAEVLWKQQQKESEAGLDRKLPIGFVLSPAGDPQGKFWVTSDGVEFAPTSKRAKEEDADKRALWNATLIVDARLAGLRDGLLDATEKVIPRTADDAQEWLPPIDGEPVIRYRVRSVDAEMDEPPHPDARWRPRLSFPTSLSTEGETSAELIIEKWRSDSATEEDRGVGNYQLLEDHQKLAECRAQTLAKRLNLPERYSAMLAIAARLHDEGKRAARWQRAFNAPTDGLYAKTLGPINFALLDGYRHEFSSLEIAAKDKELLELPTELQELALHLIAAHHGFARPVISVRGCEDAPPSKLEGRAREVALRFARLQRIWGPWGLAWWESLLRAVDHQASRENDTPDASREQEVVQ